MYLLIEYVARVELDLDEICDDLGIDIAMVSSATTMYNVVTIMLVSGETFTYEFDDLIIREDIDTLSPTTKIVRGE
tara:strand:- start:770 stop:997 length:228 start_codon:yes stop_codon:yes gene_type:complete